MASVELRGLSNRFEALAVVDDVSLRIEHGLHRYPGELSGGQQQRGALARALVAEPGRATSPARSST